MIREEKREKTLRGIFDFYSRQQILVGKKATFDEIKKELDHLNMGEFFRFCLDFGIPIKYHFAFRLYSYNLWPVLF